MGELSITAKCKIHDSKLDEFKGVAADCIESVRANDPGTLRYDWFLDEANMECCVLEKYDSSDNLMAHVGNLGEKLGALMNCCDVALEVYGDPSSQVREAFGPLGAKIYAFHAGA